MTRRDNSLDTHRVPPVRQPSGNRRRAPASGVRRLARPAAGSGSGVDDAFGDMIDRRSRDRRLFFRIRVQARPDERSATLHFVPRIGRPTVWTPCATVRPVASGRPRPFPPRTARGLLPAASIPVTALEGAHAPQRRVAKERGRSPAPVPWERWCTWRWSEVPAHRTEARAGMICTVNHGPPREPEPDARNRLIARARRSRRPGPASHARGPRRRSSSRAPR